MEVEIPDQTNVVEADFTQKREAMSVEYLPTHKAMERQRNRCQHKRVWLDIDNHCLVCQACDGLVDPIKYLERWAKRERALDNRVAMIKQFERREAAARQRERRKHMPRSEWKKTDAEIQSEHREHGHPREHMWFTKNMTNCYCGSGWSRVSFPELEAEVKAARKIAEQRQKLRVVEVREGAA